VGLAGIRRSQNGDQTGWSRGPGRTSHWLGQRMWVTLRRLTMTPGRRPMNQ
jgi:hypothetical protein